MLLSLKIKREGTEDDDIEMGRRLEEEREMLQAAQSN